MRWWHFKRRDQDLERELRSDLELEEEEQRESGLPPEEARYAALRAFGNPALIREQTRASWSWTWIESLARDLRYGLRTLRRTPGFTIIAIVVMALGIGANIALFTVVRSILLKPLPYRDAGRLVLMYESDRDHSHPAPWLPVNAGSFWEWQRAAQSAAQMALISPFQGYNVSAESGKLPEVIEAAWCTDNFFSLLGVQPMLGRGFTAEDDKPGAAATVILSSSFWTRRYGADPGIVGKTIWLDAKPYTIIGVLPASFVYSGAFGGNNVQVWTPVRHEAPVPLLQTYGDHESSCSAAHRWRFNGRA
jgi:putative ABC transport system permease protein